MKGKMLTVNWADGTIKLDINTKGWEGLTCRFEKHELWLTVVLLSIISITSFLVYYSNGLGVAYNDARSHLNIGRRVVEGLQPGLAQLGSVWLPLLHALMIPTIWSDFMWHSGLAGALPSMVSFVFTGAIISLLLKRMGIGWWGRLTGLFIFVANINVLYLQSTAMTELLLLATMTAGVYEIFVWYQDQSHLLPLFKSAVFIMLASLVRYDAWFLLVFLLGLLLIDPLKKRGIKHAEGLFFLFGTLAGLGVVLWFLWNLLIFKDPFYFAFGPFSAYSQQKLLESAGSLVTKGNLYLSIKFYVYALAYNQGAFTALLGLWGFMALLVNKNLPKGSKIAAWALTAPFFFNVIALFWGHSVLHIQGLSGDTLFNVRYGIMMAPSIAVFVGFLVDRLKRLRPVFWGMLVLVTFFTFVNKDAVTIDDALYGASQKNVSEVSGWLRKYAQGEGYIFISAASHDAIIFSSGLPMKRFIHEGTGKYWQAVNKNPSKLAKWVIMRTHDESDLTFKAMKDSGELAKYRLVEQYPFADIYQLKDEYLSELISSIDQVKSSN
jgi:hypothetical protein